MASASDPRLVTLREHLSAARADEAPFGVAWEQARAELLADLSHPERKSWTVVLAATRPAWRAAYYGGASGRVDCVTALEAFAADGELEPLRHEPVRVAVRR